VIVTSRRGTAFACVASPDCEDDYANDRLRHIPYDNSALGSPCGRRLHHHRAWQLCGGNQPYSGNSRCTPVGGAGHGHVRKPAPAVCGLRPTQQCVCW